MPPSQLLVFFDEFPSIDTDALADRINACDPEEEEDCVAERVEDSVGVPTAQAVEMGLKVEKLRLASFRVALDEFQIALLVHSCPAPNRCISAALLDKETKERLGQHQAFALISLVGGEDYEPVERVIFLYKVAFALLDQGGIGVGCEESLLAYPRDFLREVEQFGVEEKGALWASLRQKGQPKELFVRHMVTEMNGEQWALTAGHGFVDLPDLACRVAGEVQIREALKWFSALYDYLFEHGPVIEAGHTVGTGEQAYLQFSAPDEGEEWLERENGMLILEKVVAQE